MKRDRLWLRVSSAGLILGLLPGTCGTADGFLSILRPGVPGDVSSFLDGAVDLGKRQALFADPTTDPPPDIPPDNESSG